MIFVTVGSAPHDFTRLVKAADDAAAVLGLDMFIQRGFTAYVPGTARSCDFVPYAEALQAYRTAELIISHASAGPIMYARKFGKPLIVFPRSGDRNEHVDNHQLETAQAIEGSSPMIEVVLDEKYVHEAIARARNKAASGLTYGRIENLRTLIDAIAGFVNMTEGVNA